MSATGAAPAPSAMIDLPALALLLAAQALGPTRVTGATGPGLDALAAALRALGALVEREGEEGEGWIVRGRGVGGFQEPACVLELGNRPGAVPLLAGILAACPFTAVLAGDSSGEPLSLARLGPPLARIGATLALRRGGGLPGTVTGTRWPLPARHEVREATGAEALALLLAGLNIPGRTSVCVRDGLDAAIALLRHFAAAVTVEPADGMVTISVTGHADLTARDLTLNGARQS